ncbi:MAG TPA: hypothetical protein VHP32_01620 [Ignavibacteria bacterium]|nr:hypothetical protein [Ignavibacteria bacterium]
MAEQSELYQIIRENEFDEEVLKICGSYSRMNELDESIDWALCRFKEEEFSSIGNNQYFLKTDEFTDKKFPQLLITFYVNQSTQTIVLINIKEV